MNYSLHVLYTHHKESDDEIDDLFSQLQQIEPPSSLVDTILASVARLSQQSPLPPSNLWENIKGLIVHNEDKEPS